MYYDENVVPDAYDAGNVMMATMWTLHAILKVKTCAI